MGTSESTRQWLLQGPKSEAASVAPILTHHLIGGSVQLCPQPPQLHCIFALDTLRESLHFDLHLSNDLLCLLNLHLTSPQRRLARLAILRWQCLGQVIVNPAEQLLKIRCIGLE